MDSLDEMFLNLMKQSPVPLSLKQLAVFTSMSIAKVKYFTSRLSENGHIKVISTQGGETKYFIVSPSEVIKEGIKEQECGQQLDKKYAEMDLHLDEKTVNLEKRIAEVEGLARNLYLNIISIMGVFVAIFSLIIINAKAIGNYLSPKDNMCVSIYKVILLNLPILISIIGLLVAVKYLLLDDLINKKIDNKCKMNKTTTEK